MRRAASVAILVVLLGASRSRAEPAAPARAAGSTAHRAAIVTLEVSGDAAPELRRSIDRSVANGLTAAGLETVGHDEATRRIAARGDLVGCGSAACVREVGELLAIGYLVRARVDARGADYAIELELVDVADGSAARQVTETCTVCTIGDLNRRTADAARRLATAGTAPPVAAASLTVAPAPAPADDKVLAWSLAAGGVVFVATGVALVVADGRGTCDDTGECAREFDTGAAGWVSLVAGVGLAGASGWLFYRDHEHEHAPSIGLSPTGASFGLAF